MKKLMLFILLAACCSLATVGCQTTEGVGEDMENAGESVQDAADEM